jgi:hypothetical protein
MSGFELTGDEIGAGVSVIVVDAAPGDGPRVHQHDYREVFLVVEGARRRSRSEKSSGSSVQARSPLIHTQAASAKTACHAGGRAFESVAPVL